jgi:hypothetical protein
MLDAAFLICSTTAIPTQHNTRGNTMYVPDPHRMAHIIASSSLKACRENPANDISDWHDGRTCAVALMFNDIEIQAAKNEVRFLTGAYRVRHFQ